MTSAFTAEPRQPVTAEDLDLAVRLASAALRGAPAAAWDARAGTLK